MGLTHYSLTQRASRSLSRLARMAFPGAGVVVLLVLTAVAAAPQGEGQTLANDQDQSQSATNTTSSTSPSISATTVSSTFTPTTPSPVTDTPTASTADSSTSTPGTSLSSAPVSTTTERPTTTPVGSTTNTVRSTPSTVSSTPSRESSTPSRESSTPSRESSTPSRVSSSKTTEVYTNDTCRKPGVSYPIGITFEELQNALEVGAVLLIDVRNRWELKETGRLPWSYNLPLPEMYEALQLSENKFKEEYGFPKPLPEDTNVVLTCRSGRRVRVAWEQIEPLGYCNVRLYFGSYLEWKARGGSLIPVAST